MLKKNVLIDLTGEKRIKIIKTILQKGANYRLQAKGFSMSPFIKNNDYIIISPNTNKKIVLGQITAFVCPQNKKLIIHRVIKISGNKIITKGDNSKQIDIPIQQKDILGVVKQTTRNNKKINFGITKHNKLIAYISYKTTIIPFICFLWKKINGK